MFANSDSVSVAQSAMLINTEEKQGLRIDFTQFNMAV